MRRRRDEWTVDRRRMPPIAQSVNQLDTSASDPRLDKGLTGKELLRLLRKRDCVELRQRGPTSSSSATNAKRSCPCTRERIWAPVFCGPSSATSNHVSERGGCGRRLRISRGHRSFLPDQHGLVATLNFYERKAARIRAVRDLGHNGVTSCRLASGTFEPSCGNTLSTITTSAITKASTTSSRCHSGNQARE